MMESKTLTEYERGVLTHLKQAQELGSTLSAYAQAFELNLNELYNGRKQLQRKGAWPKGCAGPRAPVSGAQAELLAVQVIEPKAAPAPREDFVCRLRAPGGLLLEFGALPGSRWLAELLSTAQGAS